MTYYICRRRIWGTYILISLRAEKLLNRGTDFPHHRKKDKFELRFRPPPRCCCAHVGLTHPSPTSSSSQACRQYGLLLSLQPQNATTPTAPPSYRMSISHAVRYLPALVPCAARRTGLPAFPATTRIIACRMGFVIIRVQSKTSAAICPAISGANRAPMPRGTVLSV